MYGCRCSSSTAEITRSCSTASFRSPPGGRRLRPRGGLTAWRAYERGFKVKNTPPVRACANRAGCWPCTAATTRPRMNEIWPGEEPFSEPVRAHQVYARVARSATTTSRGLDAKSIFRRDARCPASAGKHRYRRCLPERLGVRSQIEDERLEPAIVSGNYAGYVEGAEEA